MKKILLIFSVLLLTMFSVKAEVLEFKDGFAQSTKKPLLVLVYAEWAENADLFLKEFQLVQSEFGEKLNYTVLNIANPDTKDFNEKFHIYPNLPYVLFFRDGGKVSRYIPRDCAKDDSCVKSKVSSFIQ